MPINLAIAISTIIINLMDVPTRFLGLVTSYIIIL